MSAILIFLFFSPTFIQGEGGRTGGNCQPGLIGKVVTGVIPFTQKRVVPLLDHTPCNYARKGVCLCAKTLPSLLFHESYTSYIRRVFAIRDETVDDYYARIFKQYEKESNENYLKRIDAIFREFPWIKCKHNPEYFTVSEKYYKLKYGKIESIFPCLHESEQQYFNRILKKEEKEDFTDYIKRMDCIYHAYPRLAVWRKIQFNKESKDWYSYREIEYNSNIKPSLNKRNCGCENMFTEEEIKKVFEKKEGEDVTAYYERVIKTLSTEKTPEEYVKTLTTARSYYPNLSLWYSTKYINLVKDYYTALYKKQTNEADEEYFKRIVSKETFETDEQYAGRVQVVREVFPNLSLWSDEKYFEDFTKNVYKTLYKKSETEDDSTYYKRICTKSATESDLSYVGRLNLIKKTYNSIPLWYSDTYFDQIKQFYTLEYTKKSTENEETYFKRLVDEESCDTTTDIYAQRIHLVHLVTVSSDIWYNEQYYEKYTKRYYETFFRKTEKESNDVWLAKAITMLPGESKDNAFKRIKLIKKYVSASGCWTMETLSKVESTKAFQEDYIAEIKKTFFVATEEYIAKSSSSSSKAVSTSESEEETVIKQGAC